MIRPEVNPEADHQSFQCIVDNSLCDVSPPPEQRDGYDPYPRPIPPELLNDGLPIGHAAFMGDFKSPPAVTTSNPVAPPPTDELI